MPGRRRGPQRTELVQLRLNPDELRLWREHVEKHGGYLSGLVRSAVSEHLVASRGSKRCPHW